MSYSVQIIADSVAPHGARLTTFQLRYPRMVHAEFMTHRAISRNASSTRAIPMSKQIATVVTDPAMPVYWGKNQKGMQATEELSPEMAEQARAEWIAARDIAVEHVMKLVEQGIHKQLAGRLIEPFAHISVVATATGEGWANFFALRCDKNAMPEIQALAVPMARAYRDSAPEVSDDDGFHLPYLTVDEVAEAYEYRKIPISLRDKAGPRFTAMSVARCARVSYLTHDGLKASVDDDIALHNMLKNNGHWSPFEHVGSPAPYRDTRSGNFVGWFQYRQSLPVSSHDTFDFAILDRFEGRDFIV